jgi:UDP-N-acetylmuramoyl-L-alanyl-D-glutamate--2,6-diaminopimelate ligase
MLESPTPRAPGLPFGGSFIGAPGGPTVSIDPHPSAPPAPCPLAELAAAVPGARVLGPSDVDVVDVAYRSRDVRPGSLFFCVPGEHVDGHEFAAAACSNGAAAVLCDRELAVPCSQVVVSSVREAMGPVSAAFFGHPAQRMTLVGVTGTNGKTTTTYLLESVFGTAGLVPGIIGTTGVRLAGRPVPFDRTTPEAPDLQRILAGMVHEGVRAVAMEVSSHGLDQHRVDGTHFACAVFTNLSRDHLDYHGTLESYFEAKARLFTPELSDAAVVNLDSEHGARLAERAFVPTVSFALGGGPAADVVAREVEVRPDGISFRVNGMRIRSVLRGRYNVSNCLGVVAAARLVGVEDGAIEDGIAALRSVPGRLEPVEAGQPFPVLVDYAHTPDSLENVLRAGRALAEGRIIVVFGCGGDRDRGKRPIMGGVATRLADLTVVTSDNPRSEDPAAIIAEIVAGARAGGGTYTVEADRRSAIRLAVAEARPGDVVVIAGKGHETGQQFADRTVPFDDRVVAAEEIGAVLEGSAP